MTNRITMANDPGDKKFKKWLDILQQESWQLELIISGFAIYGLFLVIEPIELAGLEAQNEQNYYRTLIFQGLKVSWYIITVNLLAHVILRGLWIGAIGLRYVSGDIDYDKLRYSPKFTRHLTRRVGSFDNYVATLEKYCSVIFAVTFLLVFYLLGLIAIAASFIMLGLWLDKQGSQWYVLWIAVPLLIFLGIGVFLTFVDFITQGWLKRNRLTSRIYYPFYWVFKYLTLSFLYRPMVYNFLDTKFGRRLSFLIVPLYLGLLVLTGTGFSISNYLKRDMVSTAYSTSEDNYLDLLNRESPLVRLASIPSKVITDPFLNVFIVFGSTVEDDVFYFNKGLKPEEDRRGIFSVFSSGTVGGAEWEQGIEKYLRTLEDMYTLKIDSLEFKPEFVITKNRQKQLGYETYLDLEGLPKGRHQLLVRRKDHVQDSVFVRTIVSIPFWYYPHKPNQTSSITP